MFNPLATQILNNMDSLLIHAMYVALESHDVCHAAVISLCASLDQITADKLCLLGQNYIYGFGQRF